MRLRLERTPGFPAEFALIYALLTGAFLVGAVFLWKDLHLKPAPIVKQQTTICRGMSGVELCVKRQLIAQGAPPFIAVSCTAAGAGRYLCGLNDGAGGCYDVVAARNRDGYPLIEAVSQKPCV